MLIHWLQKPVTYVWFQDRASEDVQWKMALIISDFPWVLEHFQIDIVFYIDQGTIVTGGRVLPWSEWFIYSFYGIINHCRLAALLVTNSHLFLGYPVLIYPAFIVLPVQWWQNVTCRVDKLMRRVVCVFRTGKVTVHLLLWIQRDPHSTEQKECHINNEYSLPKEGLWIMS